MKILTPRRIASCFALALLTGCGSGDLPTAPPGLPPGSKAEIPAPTGEPKKVRGVGAGSSNAN